MSTIDSADQCPHPRWIALMNVMSQVNIDGKYPYLRDTSRMRMASQMDSLDRCKILDEGTTIMQLAPRSSGTAQVIYGKIREFADSAAKGKHTQ